MIRVIAECGVNFKDFNEAVEYAEKAKEINANVIKYQYVYNPDLPQMTKGEWKALKGYCDMIGIEFLATPSSVEIALYLYSIGMEGLKIGSDRLIEDWDKILSKEYIEYILVSDGYYEWAYNDIRPNMYCVSLYPCDPKFIDFAKMKDNKYIAFSDHTLEYNKEWCDKIKACCNIEYVEKHFKLTETCIDKDVSLGYNEMKEFIVNLKGE